MVARGGWLHLGLSQLRSSAQLTGILPSAFHLLSNPLLGVRSPLCNFCFDFKIKKTPLRCFYKWWPGRGSNPRHEDFQSSALPTELPGRPRISFIYNFFLVGKSFFYFFAYFYFNYSNILFLCWKIVLFFLWWVVYNYCK